MDKEIKNVSLRFDLSRIAHKKAYDFLTKENEDTGVSKSCIIHKALLLLSKQNASQNAQEAPKGADGAKGGERSKRGVKTKINVHAGDVEQIPVVEACDENISSHDELEGLAYDDFLDDILEQNYDN